MLAQYFKEPSLLQCFELYRYNLVPAHFILAPRAVDEVKVVPDARHHVPKEVEYFHFGIAAFVLPYIALLLVNQVPREPLGCRSDFLVRPYLKLVRATHSSVAVHSVGVVGRYFVLRSPKLAI